MKTWVVLDRFEGEMAVLEQQDGVCRAVPRSHLPAESCEGDVLEQSDQGWRLDPERTLLRKRRIEEKMRRLWSDR